MRFLNVTGLALLVAATLLAGCGTRRPADDRSAADRGPAPESTGQGDADVPEGHGHDDHAGHGHDDHDEARPGSGHGESAHGAAEEGHVSLSTEALAEAGIEFAPAGPCVLARTLEFAGEVALNSDRLAHIVPRFPGVAREVRKQLGERVRAGDVMAVIESNESLTSYEVKSLTSGTVIEKHITLGEFVADNTDIYVVADLSTVWVNLVVPPRDLGRLRTGQKVRVHAAQSDETATGTLTYLGPVVSEETRSVTARVELDNPRGEWRPGLFASGRIEVGEEAVALAVPREALQTIAGAPAVFVRTKDGVAARSIAPGREDETFTEIVSGLRPGELVAVSRTFLLKAELGKAEAEHVH